MSSGLNLDESVIVIVLRVIIFLTSTLGNGFIVFLILRVKKIRNEKFNLLILLLAVGDVILGFAAAIRASQSLFKENGRFVRMTCLALGTPWILGTHVTQIAMLLIAVDRLDSIFRLNRPNPHIVYFCYVLSIPAVIGYSLIPTGLLFVGGEDVRSFTCSVGMMWHPRYGDYMFAIMITFNLSIPTLYAAIFVLFNRYTKRASRVTVVSTKNNFQSIVYGVVIVYILLWCIPKWLKYGLNLFGEFGVVLDVAAFAVGFCEQLSACVNIVVYGYTHRDLRKAMKNVAFKWRTTPFRVNTVSTSTRRN